MVTTVSLVRTTAVTGILDRLAFHPFVSLCALTRPLRIDWRRASKLERNWAPGIVQALIAGPGVTVSAGWPVGSRAVQLLTAGVGAPVTPPGVPLAASAVQVLIAGAGRAMGANSGPIA